MNKLHGRNWELHIGDAGDVLKTLPAEFVHCIVTSPPYWGLRDYNVEGQIGLEKTPEKYITTMVALFAELRRVLRSDGTLWLNMGDSYANDGKWGGTTQGFVGVNEEARRNGTPGYRRRVNSGLKPKDLVGMPWRLALALQAAGWYLRSDIIWAKPNPMPESVTDRPTKSHEYIFLLAKSQRYFYDAQAIVESSNGYGSVNKLRKYDGKFDGVTGKHYAHSIPYPPGITTRNRRTVWTITSQPYSEAHFATFPEELPMLCIKAGSSEKGCCPTCGAPWTRIVHKNRVATRPGTNTKIKVPAGWETGPGAHGSFHGNGHGEPQYRDTAEIGNRDPGRHVTTTATTGWQPTCDCEPADAIPCIVLDPFTGSGTTGKVAIELGRRFIGVELNPEYAQLARKRILNPKKHAAPGQKTIPSTPGQMDLFSSHAVTAAPSWLKSRPQEF